MKLVSVELSLEEKLSEFENWITASIQQVSDTATYRSELEKISLILDSLGAATNGFQRVEDCNPEQMAIYCIAQVERIIAEFETVELSLTAAIDLLDSLISMLFLVTGKSDNNMKCQFPVYLIQSENRTVFPMVNRRGNGRVNFEFAELGRVIKQEKVSKLIGEALVLRARYPGAIDLESEAVWLLKGYINSILNSDESIEQLWALGFSYFTLKVRNPGFEGKLLAPIVAFKVRGSVAAQSGHLPEKILRSCMTMWGLKSGIDFNIDDVVISGSDLQRDDLIEAAAELQENNNGGRIIDDLSADPTKTRAYDFVLPYRTPGWSPRIFIQAQFYAGDSGSVSHKVVDQTRSSRVLTRAIYPRALFVEYLDGAGYYSSLYRDLKHMLEMPSTADFIQVRTAHVKLRRTLQNIGFLTPLDFVHALLRAEGSLERARLILIDEGYSEEEILRCYNFCIAESLMLQASGLIQISPRLLVNSRRIMLLDIIVVEGERFQRSGGSVVVIAPGVGADRGVGLPTLGRIYERLLGATDSGATRFSLDLGWLNSSGLIQIKTI
ncbi:hypothetical protein [Pseudomonas sp. CC6-YY-74]|uniref:hypothetical protein n=1 Tax=Pseudomonas sp. CC6-YY-74 TaxID=1930532 RepID=UPI0012AB6FF7|nr:hypothetical protein [Pseudomonas sp. CC6-YY-74]